MACVSTRLRPPANLLERILICVSIAETKSGIFCKVVIHSYWLMLHLSSRNIIRVYMVLYLVSILLSLGVGFFCYSM